MNDPLLSCLCSKPDQWRWTICYRFPVNPHKMLQQLLPRKSQHCGRVNAVNKALDEETLCITCMYES